MDAPVKRLTFLPTTLTLGNGVCGFLAIVCASRIGGPDVGLGGDPYFAWSGWLILAAMIFDALDGYAARLSRTTSQFGAELAGGARQPGGVAVEGVEDHGGQDEPPAPGEVWVAAEPHVRAADAAGADDGQEATDAVAQRQRGRKEGESFHGCVHRKWLVLTNSPEGTKE